MIVAAVALIALLLSVGVGVGAYWLGVNDGRALEAEDAVFGASVFDDGTPDARQALS